MSYAQRGPGWPPARDEPNPTPPQTGSVRAARERLAQAQERLRLHQGSPDPRDQDPLASQYSSLRSPNRTELPPQTYNPAFQRQPSPQSPQWPLTRNFSPSGSARSLSSPINSLRDMPNPYQGAIGVIPENPAPPPQQNLPEPPRNAQRNYPLSPEFVTSRPFTGSSQLTDSSLGTIPDFPIPMTNAPTQRSRNLNPNAFQTRRGPSSYYSQYSNVSPIKEEDGLRGSMKSYASSTVIPQNPTDFYFDDTPESDEEAFARKGGKYSSQSENESPVTLFRQASLGKRMGKPALTSIKGPTSTPPRDGSQGKESSSEESLLRNDSRLVPPVPPVPAAVNTTTGHARPDSHTYSDELDDYLGELEKSDPSSLRQVPMSTLGERVGPRKPPNLNVDKVRDQEARGSLTSLPDLIRRATRLAANLDRGKTASRLGMDWMLNESGNGRNSDMEKQGRGAGMVRIPSPAETRGTEWPSNRSRNPILPDSRSGTDGKRTPNDKAQRRCCGMSRSAFIGIMFLLTLLIAAAVVIPVALIVIPKQSTPALGDTTCAKKLSCANNGMATLLSDGSCGCICVDGFQGARCKTVTDAGCTTVPIGGNSMKATAGIGVAALIKSASTFSIPLNSTTLMLEFAKANMTCATENALVSFAGLDNVGGTARLVRARQVAMTTNGIVIASGAAPTPTAGAAEAPSSTITVVPASGTSTSPTVPVTNSTAQAFAKVGILFVLQDSGTLNAAVKAQEKLDVYMKAVVKEGGATPGPAKNVILGNGYAINMWDWKLTLKNGTVYGAGFNGTATTINGGTAAV